jgi:4-hydroxy-3-polyprenylbenzoate decarboxylase
VKKRIIIGISGASGPIYGVRLLEVLAGYSEWEKHLILTSSAIETVRYELKDWDVKKIEKLADFVHSPQDMTAAIASGSFITQGMVVAPCSMKTLGNIAHSTGGDLLTRAADVALKERRRLILLPRETPLHLGHLRNMVSVTEMGAVVLPPVPAFYHQPKSIDDLVNQTIGKILDQFQIEHDLFKRWKDVS